MIIIVHKKGTACIVMVKACSDRKKLMDFTIFRSFYYFFYDVLKLVSIIYCLESPLTEGESIANR